MKHINYFNEAKKTKMLSLGMNKSVSTEDDPFIREVWCYCKQETGTPSHLTNKTKYKLYAEFETSAMFSKKCYIILNNENEFMGYDSGYFIEEYDWQMINNPKIAKEVNRFNL